MELRNRVRYRLSADAVFGWQGPKGNRLLAEGVTRDISVAGAFIFTRTCPPVGTTVELEIFLSTPPSSGVRTVQIKTEARVIRVEHSTDAQGFAAVSRDFTLLFDSNTTNEFGVSSADDEGDIFGDHSLRTANFNSLYSYSANTILTPDVAKFMTKGGARKEIGISIKGNL
jgi:hypothetical protein